MEPYRPYVDLLVVEICEEEGFPTTLTKEVKARLLTLPTLDVEIDGQCRPLMLAAAQTASSLLRCFTGEARRLSYPLLRCEAND